MKLPAAAIAAVFGCGSVLGQWRIAQRSSSQMFLLVGFALVGFLICAGFVPE